MADELNKSEKMEDAKNTNLDKNTKTGTYDNMKYSKLKGISNRVILGLNISSEKPFFVA